METERFSDGRKVARTSVVSVIRCFGIGSAARVSDVTQVSAMLHGEETEGTGDAGYQGVEKGEML